MKPQTPPPPDAQSIHLTRAERSYARRASLLTWLIPAAFLLGIGVGYLLWGGKIENSAQTAVKDEATGTTRYDVPVDDDPSMGPTDAPVTIIEFSDYQCPYCKKWHDEVLPQILKAYPDQVRFVYRDFPLSGHVGAAPAAEAAGCAGAQEKYWEYQDALFSEEYSFDETGFAQIAKDLKLDEDKFAKCLASDKYVKEAQADYEFAANLGVQSTPTFFINGIAVIGAQPFDSFKQVIDQELASAKN